MTEKLAYLWPEIALFVGTCIVMVIGLSPAREVRRFCAPVTVFCLLIAGLLAVNSPPTAGAMFPNLAPFAKTLIAFVGIGLVLLCTGTADREEEAHLLATGAKFDPLRTMRAEFYAFILFSLTGLMLCASADDLIWMFLALELTSLPTYVMVTLSTKNRKSQEAGVKYFFLGAMGAAIFLYGFALLYGATGSTHLGDIAEHFSTEGISGLAMAGMILALVGVSFKIAAVPMHFYTADVYEGAAAPVSAFLAFVPKAAGFLTIILLVGTLGWRYGEAHGSLPGEVRIVLWVVAALTMTFGNVLAILQTSVKRMLAYSSIAHSGYMLVGVIVGPGDGGFAQNGIAAVLFYLFSYGVMNMGAFAVIACLERRNADGTYREIETVDDLNGLCKTRPVLGWVMVVSAMSLLGMPPLLGFFAKVPLFSSAISAGEITLVIVLGLNSAAAAFYYLRLVYAPMLAEPDPEAEPIESNPYLGRKWAAVASAGGVLLFAAAANAPIGWAARAAEYEPRRATHAEATVIDPASRVEP